MDAYRAPSDNKLEPRPRLPTTINDFYRCAKREAWAFALFLGIEHYDELTWRYGDELRETRRRMLHEMRNPSPSYEQIRFFCFAPNAEGMGAGDFRGVQGRNAPPSRSANFAFPGR